MWKINAVHPADVVIIKRHPFARFDTIRTKCEPRQECAWCGGFARFHYGKWFDDGNPTVMRECFCNINCYRSFYA